MTQINFDFGKLDATGIVDLANDSISVTPTSRAPRHDARAGCPRPCHPPEESDRAITILPHCHISIHTSHEWEVTILSKLLKN